VIGLPTNTRVWNVAGRTDSRKGFDSLGMWLLAKRLERGRFVWSQASCGGIVLSPAQLSMLLEGIDWRMPVRTHDPDLAA
jgi:transposase